MHGRYRPAGPARGGAPVPPSGVGTTTTSTWTWRSRYSRTNWASRPTSGTLFVSRTRLMSRIASGTGWSWVFDLGQLPGRAPVIVSDYVGGGTLGDVLRRPRMQWTRWWGADLARAVGRAAQRGCRAPRVTRLTCCSRANTVAVHVSALDASSECGSRRGVVGIHERRPDPGWRPCGGRADVPDWRSRGAGGLVWGGFYPLRGYNPPQTPTRGSPRRISRRRQSLGGNSTRVTTPVSGTGIAAILPWSGTGGSSVELARSP